MTTTIASAPTAPTETTAAAALSAAHDRWFEQIRIHVGPATKAGAGFWERRAAAHYLNDEFLARFWLERNLPRSMPYFLDAGDATQLTVQAARIERVRARLARNGGRHGTGAVVSADAAALIRDLWGWCTRLEQAIAGLGRDMLPARAQRLLDRLAAFDPPAAPAPTMSLSPHSTPWGVR